MTPAQRQARLLATLPLLLQEGANVRELLAVLARVLSGEPGDGGMEYGVTRVLRSRWHPLAAGWAEPVLGVMLQSELARLAALFGFPPYNDERDDRFRRRLLEFIAVHRAGLTTASAILRLVALVYDAEDPPVITWDDHGRVAVAELRARDGQGQLRDLHVELIENPSAEAAADFGAVEGGRTMLVHNAGLDPAIPEIRLHPGKDTGPAHVPVLRHMNTGLHLIYVGVVPAGQTLTLRHRLPPLIGGVPQTAPVLLSNPFTFDAPTTLFDNATFSTAARDSTLPALAPGETTWRYDTLDRGELAAFLSAWPDLLGLHTLALPAKASPPADLHFRWREAVPAALALRVPADFVSRHFPDLSAQVRWLERALDYGRAAGVRARVELALPYIRERLDVSDDLSFAPDVAFADHQPIAELAPPPAIGILLVDALPPTAESLTFDGHFDATYFDTSLFAEPETEP